MVVYHEDAVVEFEALRDRQQRKGVLTIVSILRQIGPKIVEPHAKPVHGTSGLWELRPGGGKVIVRPLYARVDERQFVVLAIGPDAVVDASGFRTPSNAHERAPRPITASIVRERVARSITRLLSSATPESSKGSPRRGSEHRALEDPRRVGCRGAAVRSRVP
jgi:hypothetical protein